MTFFDRAPRPRAILLAAVILSTLGCSDDGGTTDGAGTTDSAGSDDVDTGTSESGTSTSTGDTSTGDTSTGDTSTGDTSTGDTSTGDTGSGEIMCPELFPSFDKSCETVDDCALVLHTVDCCGNEAAWGIHADAVEAFTEAEAICDAQYPECDCPAGPPVAEDGNSAPGLDGIAVDCQMGACTSYVP